MPIHSPHAFLKEDRWLFSPPPVLISEHAKLDNSKIGLTSQTTQTRGENHQHLGKELPDQNL